MQWQKEQRVKIGFVADIHIKLGQKDVPEEWARNRFLKLFNELSLHNPDVWILGGDIFDKLPNMAELELYFQLISEYIGRDQPVLIIPGNHESVKKDTTFLSYLKQSSRAINSNVTIIDDYHSCGELGVDFIPYNKLKDFAKGKHPEFKQPVCVSHFRAEIPPHVKPEIDLDLFNRWKVVLAGDLHSYSNSQRNILYPGSPVTTSFHRSLVDTGFIMFDTDDLSHEWIKLDVPQLIRKTVKAGEPTPVDEYHHIVYEMEGSLADLAGVETDGVVTKKIIQRSTDTALILDAEMTMRDEAKEYLLYILELDDNTVEQVLKVFDDEQKNFA